jgi:hypothetical protein
MKLQRAIETETQRDIKAAIKLGKQCLLEGTLPDGTKYCTELMKQAYKVH